MRKSCQKYLLPISSNIYFSFKMVLILNIILLMSGDFEASKFHAPKKFNFEGISTCRGFGKRKDFSCII